LLKKVCERLGFNDKMYPPKMFQYRIDQAKNQGITPDVLSKMRGNFIDEKVAAVYVEYENQMKQANALDFNDLLLKTVQLFQNEEVLDMYQERFKYIMVDEYQDTNKIQYQLVQLLSKKY